MLLGFLLFSSFTGFAAVGDAAGSYYYTDIQTILYHAPVPAYNIGGKTVIDAEALNWHYGFDVYWYQEDRLLAITDKGGAFNSLQAMSGELCEGLNGRRGEAAGTYYSTDIVTTLNGNVIESYNIGGRTCIVAEAMQDFGYTVIWDEAARMLTISKPADFYKIETDYGVIKTADNCQRAAGEHGFWKAARGIVLNGAAAGGMNEQLELKTTSGVVLTDGLIELVKLSDLCDAIGASCVMTETETVGRSEWVNGIAYDTPAFAYSFDIEYDENAAFELPVYKAEEEEGMPFEVDGGVYYAYHPSVTVNGAASGFYAPAFSHFGGSGVSKTDFGIYVINKEVCVPSFMAAELLGLT